MSDLKSGHAYSGIEIFNNSLTEIQKIYFGAVQLNKELTVNDGYPFNHIYDSNIKDLIRANIQKIGEQDLEELADEIDTAKKFRTKNAIIYGLDGESKEINSKKPINYQPNFDIDQIGLAVISSIKDIRKGIY